MEKFDLECQFDFYLEKVKLDKKTMPPDQLREVRQAFIAGISCMLVVNLEIGLTGNKDAQSISAKLWEQTTAYWNEKLQEAQRRQN